MDTNDTNQNQDQNNDLSQYRPTTSTNRTPIFVVIVIILLGALIYFFIQNQSTRSDLEASNKELRSTVLQLDSVSNQLDQKIIELTRLGQNVDTLLAVKAELEEEKNRLLTADRSNRGLIQRLQNKVDGYTELLLMKDEEIKNLKSQNQALLTENTDLKTTQLVLTDSIYDLSQTTTELNEKIGIASQLEVEGMRIYAVNSSGKEREYEFRNRHIEQLKINFFVGENKVAPIEGKSLLIRVIDPNNNVLFDVTRGSGSFSIDGKEMFFTAKKEILYDRKRQAISLLYDKGSEYDIGKHTVEVYTDEYLMGTGSFVVK